MSDDIPLRAFKNADIDFSGFRAMLKDMATYPKKLKRQFVRNSMRRISQLLVSEEKRQTQAFALPRGSFSKWGRTHSGDLKKGIKGRTIFTKYDGIFLFAGIKLSKQAQAKYTKTIPPTTSGGIWLNFGTRRHSIRRGSTNKSQKNGGFVNGIPQYDWVVKTYNNTKEQIQNFIDSDTKEAFEKTLANVYKPSK